MTDRISPSNTALLPPLATAPAGTDPLYRSTRALFLACRALDLSAMQTAIIDGADAGAKDVRSGHNPLTEFVVAWCRGPSFPDPEPHLDLLARAGADLSVCKSKAYYNHPVSYLYSDAHLPLFHALNRRAPVADTMEIKSGHLALMSAFRGAPGLLAACFANGSYRDPRGHDGGTLLHFAAQHEPYTGGDILGVFDFLLDAGLDESVRNNFGQTAMEMCETQLIDINRRSFEAARVRHVARSLSAKLPEAGQAGKGGRRL